MTTDNPTTEAERFDMLFAWMRRLEAKVDRLTEKVDDTAKQLLRIERKLHDLAGDIAARSGAQYGLGAGYLVNAYPIRH